jgi:RNA polymerase sigma-70 factor, ECF subfamily
LKDCWNSLVERQFPIELSAESESLAAEQTLVQGVLDKDRKATAEFVSVCADWTYAFVCRRLAPRRQAVEDLMQEILVTAWQALPGFRGDASLRHWVLGIARHKVEDYFRRSIREVELTADDSVADATSAPMLEEHMDLRGRQERVQKTLATLPEPYALALIWRYRDEKSLREMAELACKTEKAIERLLARARENFRRRWNDVHS